MKTIDKLLKIGLLVIMFFTMSGCATTGDTNQSDTKKYNALMGNGGTYDDTQSLASGGVTNNVEAHAKAQEAYSKGDIDRALYYYVKALEFNPKDIPALMSLARIHTSQSNIRPTILAYQLILEQEPDNIEALEGAGLTLLKINRANEAKATLDRANKLSPDRPMTLMGLAVYHDLISDFDRAKEYYQKAAGIAPKSVKILNNYAYSRYLAGDLEMSEQLYKKLLRQSPKHPQGLLNYGLLQARLGKTNEALHTLKKVISESEAYNELGYIYMMQQDYGKARRLFELAISSSPTYFERASKNLEQLKLLVSRLTKTGTKSREDASSVTEDSKINKSSLNLLLSKWVVYYEAGEVDNMLSLLSEGAEINGTIGHEAIKKDLTNLFSNDLKRNLYIDEIKWDLGKSQGVGDGTYEIRITKDGKREIIKGNINITINLENNDLVITKLNQRKNTSS